MAREQINKEQMDRTVLRALRESVVEHDGFFFTEHCIEELLNLLAHATNLLAVPQLAQHGIDHQYWHGIWQAVRPIEVQREEQGDAQRTE